MQTIVHEMRGIPFFLLKEYLEEMGGKEVEENVIQGEGWKVHLEKMEPFRLFSLSVGQTRLTVEMEDDVVEDFTERFRKKTLRAGG
ncbi:MAG: DUF1952 domain-containing protein [Anaerolineales bacterium]|jgi:hypothetical protein|nr:DUF1952 domain-containing protein [Anaerolineales bacterium]